MRDRYNHHTNDGRSYGPTLAFTFLVRNTIVVREVFWLNLIAQYMIQCIKSLWGIVIIISSKSKKKWMPFLFLAQNQIMFKKVNYYPLFKIESQLDRWSYVPSVSKEVVRCDWNRCKKRFQKEKVHLIYLVIEPKCIMGTIKIVNHSIFATTARHLWENMTLADKAVYGQTFGYERGLKASIYNNIYLF